MTLPMLRVSRTVLPDGEPAVVLRTGDGRPDIVISPTAARRLAEKILRITSKEDVQ